MDLYSIKSNGERFFPTHKVNYYIAVGIIPVIDDVRLAARSKSGLCFASHSVTPKGMNLRDDIRIGLSPKRSLRD